MLAATHRALPEFAPEGQVEFVQVVQVEEALAVMSQWKLRGGVMSQVAGFNHSVAAPYKMEGGGTAQDFFVCVAKMFKLKHVALLNNKCFSASCAY